MQDFFLSKLLSCFWKRERKKFFVTLEMSRPIILHRKIPFHHLKRTKAETFFFYFRVHSNWPDEFWQLLWSIEKCLLIPSLAIVRKTPLSWILFFPMQNWRASKVYLGKAYFSRDNFQFMNLTSKIKDFFKFWVFGIDFVTYYLVASLFLLCN